MKSWCRVKENALKANFWMETIFAIFCAKQVANFCLLILKKKAEISVLCNLNVV